MVKDDDELRLIRAAVALGAKLFDRAVEVMGPGTTEVEVAAEMELAARRAGAEEMSFPTIIASGAQIGAAARARFLAAHTLRSVRGL